MHPQLACFLGRVRLKECNLNKLEQYETTQVYQLDHFQA